MYESNNSTKSDTPLPSAENLINTISAIYTTPFWEELRGYVDELSSLRKIQEAIKILHINAQSEEALDLVIALYDVIGIEVPESILGLEKYPGAVKLFMEEFIDDTTEIICDYEFEENGGASK